ncbi:MAG: MFS transporter [Alphaproteobacteria bacterium]|nr:MFS transporter [Alphaproteobacteria bacterium]
MTDRGEPISWRIQGPIYLSAFFFGPLQTLATMCAALFVAGLISVELPFLIAFILSSRQILTVLLSVNSGALVDRFGSRNATIAFGCLAVMTAMAYPFVPGLFGQQWGTIAPGAPVWLFIAALIAVQIAAGYTEGNTWVGIQALVSHRLGGQPTYAGRMVFTARIGGIVGPILIGPAWDIWGPFGGFSLLALWIALGTGGTFFVPRQTEPEAARQDENPVPEPEESKPPPRPRPDKGPGFVDSLKLLLIPAVALVMMLTVLRQAGSGIHSSFYVIWLDKEIGLSGTLIGGLMSTANVASAIAAISTGRIASRVAHHWLLIVTIGMTILGTAIVPALGSVYVLLMMAISIRGVGQGLNLPMMITMLAQNVPVSLQGRVTALRVAFNRGGQALVPLGAGALAEVVGIANSFYIVGAVGGILLVMLSFWAARRPEFRSHP